MCHDTHKFVGLDVKKMPNQMSVYDSRKYIGLR